MKASAGAWPPQQLGARRGAQGEHRQRHRQTQTPAQHARVKGRPPIVGNRKRNPPGSPPPQGSPSRDHAASGAMKGARKRMGREKTNRRRTPAALQPALPGKDRAVSEPHQAMNTKPGPGTQRHSHDDPQRHGQAPATFFGTPARGEGPDGARHRSAGRPGPGNDRRPATTTAHPKAVVTSAAPTNPQSPPAGRPAERRHRRGERRRAPTAHCAPRSDDPPPKRTGQGRRRPGAARLTYRRTRVDGVEIIPAVPPPTGTRWSTGRSVPRARVPGASRRRAASGAEPDGRPASCWRATRRPAGGGRSPFT